MLTATKPLLKTLCFLIASAIGEHTIKAFAPGLVEWQGRVAADPVTGQVAFDWLGSQFSVTVEKASYLRATFNTSSLSAGAHVKLRSFLTVTDDYPLPHTEIALHPSIQEYVLAAALPGKSTVTVFNNQSVCPHFISMKFQSICLQ